MRTTLIVALLVGFLLPAAAMAQSGNSVTVLQPERFRVSEEVANELYAHLGRAVGEHQAYELADLPPQTLDDLLLTIGCTDSEAQCVGVLGEILETDYLVWGNVGGSGEAFLVELTFWNVAEGREVYKYTKAIEGDLESFTALMPVLARGVIFGPVGEVRIEFQPPDASVEVDTHPIPGTSPIILTGLDLGPHVVVARHDEHFDFREVIVADVNPVTAHVEMVPLVEEIEQTSGRLWTWFSLGTGVALTGTGVAFGLLAQSNQEDYDQRASAVRVDQRGLSTLQDEGERNALLANIFYGAGAAGIIAAVILFFVEAEDAPATDENPQTQGPRLGVGQHGFTLDFEF